MKKPAKDSSKIAKSAGVVGIAVMFSRVLGLIREQIFAGLFGAGFAYDAFVVAFRIPNLLRDLFGEGALSAAFVTVFSQYDERYDAEQTYRLASNVLSFFAVFISILVLIASLFAENIVTLLAPGFNSIPGKVELTATLTRIMLPFLLLISLSAVVMGMLNTRGRFFIPSLASSFFNLGSIVGGLSLVYILPHYGIEPIIGMAIGTLTGGLLQLLIQLPTLRRTGFRYRPQLNLKDPGLIRVLKLMIPATIGLSAVQLNIFINTNFAASCGEGSVSWLNYAFRLVQLPIGMFGVALSIAVLPVFGRLTANRDISGLKETLASSLSMVFCLTIPAAAGLIMLADPIIGIIFERGAFTSADTSATAHALSFYAIGLFAYSANKLLVPAFYALDDTKYPVMGSFLSVAINIAFIHFTISSLQHLSIALSTSVTMLFNFLFLSTVLYIKLKGFSVSYLVGALGKIFLSTAAMILIIYLAKTIMSNWFSNTLLYQITALVITISCAVAIYGSSLYLLKLQELVELTSKFKSRFSRS